MKIITKSTFVVGKNETIAPDTEIDMEEAEAISLIEKGLAIAAPKPVKKTKSKADEGDPDKKPDGTDPDKKPDDGLTT